MTPSLPRTLRGRLAALVVASGLLASGTFAFAGSNTPCTGTFTRPDGWDRISPPNTFHGAIVDFQVQPYFAERMLVTDGITVAFSQNGGCSFETAYTAPGSIVTDDPSLSQQIGVRGVAQVTQLAVSPGRDMHSYAVLGSTQPSAPGVPTANGATQVVVSADGRNWAADQHGQVFPGSPLRLSVANDTTAYLAIRQNGSSSTGQVWQTTDAGSTWLPKGTGSFDDIVVDPAHPDSIWGWSATGLVHSTDSGATFTTVPQVAAPVSTVQVYDQTDGRSRVLAYLKPGGVMISPDGSAAGFTPKAAPPFVDGADRTRALGVPAAQGTDFNDFTASGQLFFSGTLAGNFTTVSVSPAGVGALKLPRSDYFADVHVTDGGAIYRAHLDASNGLPVVHVPPLPKQPPVSTIDGQVIKSGPPTLTPTATSVQLRPGQSRDVKMDLTLPANPSPLDVFFLVDTTSSMSAAINGLRVGIGDIVNKLTSSGIDVHFGVGEFRDYPISPYGNPGTTGGNADFPYRRDLPITAPGQQLRDTISALAVGSGGGDDPESTLTGVDQAATGAGQPMLGIGGAAGNGYFVPPGEQAGFRTADSLHVIIVATDTYFHTPDDARSVPTDCVPPSSASCQAGYPGPGFDSVIAHLSSHNIRVVGLDVSGEDNSPATRDLSRLARGTNTYAPPGGVVCTPDGSIRVRAGAPLVCGVQTGDDTLNLAPAIVGLLRALSDITPVSVTATTLSGESVATANPSLFPTVDVKARNLLPFTVRVTCPSGGDSDHLVNVATHVRGNVVASGLIDLTCRGPVPVVPPIIPPPAVVPLAAAVLAPVPVPPPPPAQLTQANPNPNPNPNPQPGAAAQEEENAQLALAGAGEQADQEAAVQEENDLPGSVPGRTMQMTARHSNGDAAMITYGLLACVTIAAGATVRYRRKQAEAPATSFAYVLDRED